jgi:UDP-N-acetylglucosamine:LPS N-acetylglucosamine transferase
MAHLSETLLLVLGGGGHTEELVALTRTLGGRHRFEYVIGTKDTLSARKLPFSGRVFRILNPREKNDRFWPLIAAKFLVSAAQSVAVVLRSRARVVLASGPGIAVAPLLLAKLLGRKVVYVETCSRIREPSLSARILYPFTDVFFVQWPQLLVRFPRATYAGRLL